MAPVRNYSSWNSRKEDTVEQIEPYQKFFFICEGANTETWYFRKLIDLKKSLGIHPLIDLCLLEKTDEDRNLSYPLQLIRFANQQKEAQEIHFDKGHDKMIVVFDADIFEEKVGNYHEILRIAEESGDIVAVTNPSFELFLLLHYEGSYESDILPNQEKILKNEKQGNSTFIYKLLLKKSGINSKKNSEIGNLAEKVEIAICQEMNLNQDERRCSGQITSNIGKIIEEIRNHTIKM